MKTIEKSKWAKIRDYFLTDIEDILSDTPFIKDGNIPIYFQDEFPQDKKPSDFRCFILVNVSEVSSSFFGEYDYAITISYFYNGVWSAADVYALEDYVDFEFQKRLKKQNEQGLWFKTPIKRGLDKVDEGIDIKTTLTSSYTMKIYFNK